MRSLARGRRLDRPQREGRARQAPLSSFAERIALINSMGAVGGFVGPYLIGEIKERTGEFTPGLLLLAGFLVAAVVIVLGLRAAAVRRSGEVSPGVAV